MISSLFISLKNKIAFIVVHLKLFLSCCVFNKKKSKLSMKFSKNTYKTCIDFLITTRHFTILDCVILVFLSFLAFLYIFHGDSVCLFNNGPNYNDYDPFYPIIGPIILPFDFDNGPMYPNPDNILYTDLMSDNPIYNDIYYQFEHFNGLQRYVTSL